MTCQSLFSGNKKSINFSLAEFAQKVVMVTLAVT